MMYKNVNWQLLFDGVTGCDNWTTTAGALRKMISEDLNDNRFLLMLLVDISRNCKCLAVQVEKTLAIRN